MLPLFCLVGNFLGFRLRILTASLGLFVFTILVWFCWIGVLSCSLLLGFFFFSGSFFLEKYLGAFQGVHIFVHPTKLSYHNVTCGNILKYFNYIFGAGDRGGKHRDGASWDAPTCPSFYVFVIISYFSKKKRSSPP